MSNCNCQRPDCGTCNDNAEIRGIVANNKKMEAQIELLKDALGFYSDRNNWRYSGQDRFDCTIHYSDAEKIKTGQTVDTVGGKRARETLKKLEEMENLK